MHKKVTRNKNFTPICKELLILFFFGHKMCLRFVTLDICRHISQRGRHENTLNSTNSNSGFALGNLKKHTVNTLNQLFLRIRKGKQKV